MSDLISEDEDDFDIDALEILDIAFNRREPEEPNPDWPEGYRSIFIKECVGYQSGIFGVKQLPYFEDGQWWIGLSMGWPHTEITKAPLFEITRIGGGGHEQDQARINALKTRISELEGRIDKAKAALLKISNDEWKMDDDELIDCVTESLAFLEGVSPP